MRVLEIPDRILASNQPTPNSFTPSLLTYPLRVNAPPFPRATERSDSPLSASPHLKDTGGETGLSRVRGKPRTTTPPEFARGLQGREVIRKGAKKRYNRWQAYEQKLSRRRSETRYIREIIFGFRTHERVSRFLFSESLCSRELACDRLLAYPSLS